MCIYTRTTKAGEPRFRVYWVEYTSEGMKRKTKTFKDYEKFIGLDMGDSRRPLLPFLGEKDKLFNELETIGFFNHTIL